MQLDKIHTLKSRRAEQTCNPMLALRSRLKLHHKVNALQCLSRLPAYDVALEAARPHIAAQSHEHMHMWNVEIVMASADLYSTGALKSCVQMHAKLP